MSKNILIDSYFRELVNNQLIHVPTEKKLQLSDKKRIARHITSSIFDKTKCALWTGYITNANNICKGLYVNFYFRKKKVALHRLLYANYVGTITDDIYLKFNCENRGKCCNIHHMNIFKYITNDKPEDDNKDDNKENNTPDIQTDSDSIFTLKFD